MYYLKHRTPGPLIAGWSTVDLDYSIDMLMPRLQTMVLGPGSQAAIFDGLGRIVEGPRVGPSAQPESDT